MCWIFWQKSGINYVLFAFSAKHFLFTFKTFISFWIILQNFHWFIIYFRLNSNTWDFFYFQYISDFLLIYLSFNHTMTRQEKTLGWCYFLHRNLYNFFFCSRFTLNFFFFFVEKDKKYLYVSNIQKQQQK